MNVTIKDIDILKAIQPQKVAKYLQERGWQQQQQIADKATIWFRENRGKKSSRSCLG
jgi:O-methyltransferase involved in polyketide biosynthesis